MKKPLAHNTSDRRLAIGNQRTTHGSTGNFCLRLHRLDLSKFKNCGSYYLLPGQNNQAKMPVEHNKTESENQQMVEICEDCAELFEPIFEKEQDAYLAPYNSLLHQEKRANLVASEQLKMVDKQWNEESRKVSQLKQQIVKIQNKHTILAQKNFNLRLRFDPFSKAILHDHSYSRVQQ